MYANWPLFIACAFGLLIGLAALCLAVALGFDKKDGKWIFLPSTTAPAALGASLGGVLLLIIGIGGIKDNWPEVYHIGDVYFIPQSGVDMKNPFLSPEEKSPLKSFKILAVQDGYVQYQETEYLSLSRALRKASNSESLDSFHWDVRHATKIPTGPTPETVQEEN